VLRLKDLNGAISWRNVEEQRARQQAKGGEVTDDWQLTMHERYWTFSADLMDDGLACVVRSEHPEIGDTLSPEQYEAMKHVNVLPPGRMRAGLFQALQQRGLKRDVAVSVTHFLAVPEMVAVSDYCSTLPRLICKQLSRDKRLKVLPSPVDLGTFPVESAWHVRYRNDPAHRWLRSLCLPFADDLDVDRHAFRAGAEPHRDAGKTSDVERHCRPL
jgi:hypothetical protein